MEKRGEEIGVQFIKTEAKTGCDSIKELHYKANDVIVRYQKQTLSKEAAERLLNSLIEIGKELKAANCPKSATDKKDEILTQLRNMCNSLKTYIASEPDTDVQKHIQVLKYRVARSLHNLENQLNSTEEIIKMLEHNKEAYDDYYNEEVGEKYNIKALQDINKELLNKLCDRYEIGEI